MNSLLAEIHNVFLFAKCLVEVLIFTGLVFVPFIALGYEIQTKRRY